MKRLLFILLLSTLRTCGVTPCYGQLTAPTEHFTDTTKQGVYLSGEEKVVLANKIYKEKERNRIGDSLIVMLRQQVWDMSSMIRIMEREREALKSQLSEAHKQIEFQQQSIKDYQDAENDFFNKNRSAFGFILGLVGGIVIVSLLK